MTDWKKDYEARRVTGLREQQARFDVPAQDLPASAGLLALLSAAQRDLALAWRDDEGFGDPALARGAR